MATNPLRSHDQSSELNVTRKSNSDCSCTNISIMQLFHEMKQEFPTVPDHVVSQCVIDNCHNRPACIVNLKQEVLAHPTSAQIYPAQSLRNNKILSPIRKPFEGINNFFNNINNNRKLSGSSEIVGESVENLNKNKNTVSFSDMPQLNNSSDINNERDRTPPKRPTTLNISKDPYNSSGSINRSGLRPTRVAPAPPSSTGSNSNNSPSGIDSDSSLNVSLNVTVSPVLAGRPPIRPPRHTSAITVQPEQAFMQETPQSPRSFTSINFELRQPTSSPQSPIHIAAGPSLTYSSSSFDARQGYQSRLQITVGGGGGSSISAMRTRPKSCYNMAAIPDEENFNNSENSLIRAGNSMPNISEETEIDSKLLHKAEGNHFFFIISYYF